MSVDETGRTVREYLDALLTGGDFAAYLADDVVWTTMETSEEVRGIDAVREFILALHRQLFDASPKLGNLTVAEGTAVLEAVFVGKHIAEFAGVPATDATIASRTPWPTTSPGARSTRCAGTSRSWPWSSR
jgi:ketosteroid isomerase-like protein